MKPVFRSVIKWYTMVHIRRKRALDSVNGRNAGPSFFKHETKRCVVLLMTFAEFLSTGICTTI